MAQKGRLVVCGDAGDALGDSIYEARLYVSGAVAGLGADCVEKEMRDEHADRGARTCSSARASTTSDPASSAATARRAGSTTSRSTTPASSDDDPARIGALRPRGHRRDPARSARGRLRHPRLRRQAPRSRTSTTCCCWARASRATRWRATASAATPNVVLGTAHAKRPLELDIPITIAGMSFGALSAPAKEALGRGASAMGTSTTTGDGGMTPEERAASKTLVYQLLPSRYGMNPDDLRRADAIEIVIGQGAKPGGGGILLGQKISDRVAEMRDLPPGIDQRSACRHPDWTGPDDLADQDRGAARDHRLGEADLHQDRRVAHLLRRRARGQGGRRRHRPRRHAGRDRGHPGRLHRARRDPDAAGRAPRRGRAAGARDAPPRPARRLRRDPLGRRRRQGARARGRRGLDRRGGAHRAGRQLARLRRRVRAHRHRSRASTTTGRRVAIPSGSPRRTTSSPRASIPSSAAAAWPTTCARWSSRPRRWPAPAASRTSRTSSPRTSWRSRSRRRRWPACRSRARTGSRGRPTGRAGRRARAMNRRAMSALADRSLGQLLEQVAAESPSPGGGSSCALACALAAGLVEMAAAFTLSRAEYAERHERMADDARARRRAARAGARARRARAHGLRRGARRAAPARGRARARRAPRRRAVRRGRQPAGGGARRRRGRRAWPPRSRAPATGTCAAMPSPAPSWPRARARRRRGWPRST